METKAFDDDLVMSLVELALARSPSEREAYIRSACASDRALMDEVCKYVGWEEQMDGFLLDPLFAPVLEHQFEPGELLAGRFRILRELGEGGMGVVYEAEDEKLDRRIALKCAKPGFRKRLPPEVRIARDITHPNVCKIFEIHTAPTTRGEIDFVVMELLEGDTLARRLRRGRMGKKQALSIARQLSAGLAEAHRNGVVHGDIKSNNVILTRGPDGGERAVITDFGLARRPGMAGVRATAHSLEAGGAMDYMAPELWKGEKSTPASDVYALGVVLCELATGRRPFAPDVPFEERERNPDVKPASRKWERLLTRCLNPDSAGRYQSAMEVQEALAPRVGRQWWLAAAAAAVLAIVAAWLTYVRVTEPSQIVRLAMPDIESSTADTPPLAAKLSADTARQLARIKGGKIARFSFGAGKNPTHVLYAALAKENGRTILRAQLTDERSRSSAKDWSATYAPGEERYIPVALAGMVTAALKLPALAVPAVNAAASKDYWAGIWYTRQNSTAADAVRSLAQAVQEDPDSALTHAALAEAQWFAHQLSRNETDFDLVREPLRQAEERGPDVPAAHRVEGYLFFRQGFYSKAEAEFERAISLEPKAAMAYTWLARSYYRDNRNDLALRNYQEAIRAEPNYYRGSEDLAVYYFNRSDLSKAAEYGRRAAALAPNEPAVHANLGAYDMELGQFPEAEREFSRALQSRETPQVDFNLGQTLMYETRDRDALEYFQKALNLGSEPPGGRSLVLMYLGIVDRRLGRSDEANRVDNEGLGIARAQMERNPRDGTADAYLGYFSAALGDRAGAELEITRAFGLQPDDSSTRWRAVLTYEELFRRFRDPGHRNKSLEILKRASPEELRDFARWPDLADLQADPRFVTMRASVGDK